MHLIGEPINHSQYGEGVVTACDQNIITIDFSDGRRSFVYPDAFETYLTPINTGSKQQINDLLVRRKMQEKQKEIENLEHQKKLAHLRSIKIPPISQPVFDLPHQEQNDPLESGFCTTGEYLSGYSKGEPRVPDRVHFNSMCILTRCPENGPENNRQIVAVAMTEETFAGESCEDGKILLHPEFRMKLSRPIAIWPYLPKEPKKAWGHTTFKYISNKIGEEILHDIRVQMSGTQDEKLAKNFYQYYCECNRLTAR